MYSSICARLKENRDCAHMPAFRGEMKGCMALAVLHVQCWNQSQCSNDATLNENAFLTSGITPRPGEKYVNRLPSPLFCSKMKRCTSMFTFKHVEPGCPDQKGHPYLGYWDLPRTSGAVVRASYSRATLSAQRGEVECLRRCLQRGWHEVESGVPDIHGGFTTAPNLMNNFKIRG